MLLSLETIGFSMLALLGSLMSASIVPAHAPDPPALIQPVVVASAACIGVTEIPSTECEALVSLYNSTNGANWTNKTNWLATTQPCSWYGVSCESGHIVGLRLESNLLSGALPSRIGDFTYLRSLNLGGNRLAGSIPVELGDLSNLEYFSLSSNRLTGNIPPQLGNLVNLQYFSLYDNRLTGSIPPQLGGFSSLLTFFDLGSNQLAGSIPEQLGNLSGVQQLRLHSNLLTGTIPAQLGNLSNLENLDLSSNRLDENIPPELGNLSNLVSLDLAVNQLSGNIPPQFGNLANLTSLSLSSNTLDGNIPTQLGNLSALRNIYLFSNQLTGSIPAELGALTGLLVLRLDGNQLTGVMPSQLGNLVNLKMLELHDNQLSGEIPRELGKLIYLEWLSLTNNQLTGSIPAQLGDLTKLRSLFLNRNQLTGSIPAEAGNMSNLEVLVLDENHLSGNIPAQLGNLSRLQRLNLYSNQLTGAIPLALGNLSNLVFLAVSGNQLEGTIPEELGSLTSLGEFYVDGNLLNGALPAGLSGLTGLQTFRFDNTNICVPRQQSIQDWLSSIPTVIGSGFVCEDLVAAVDVTKLVNGVDVAEGASPFFRTGDRVTWTYHITNTGNIPLASIVILDNREGIVTDCTPTLGDGLATGANTQCTAAGVVQSGQYSNTAVVTGTATIGIPQTVRDSDDSRYVGVDFSDAGVSEQVTPASADAGEVVTYTLVVTDPAAAQPVTLALTDTLPAAIQAEADSVVATLGVATLDPATHTLHWRYTTTAGRADTATITYRARLTTQCTAALTNQARLFVAGVETGQATATLTLKSALKCDLYLPAILKPEAIEPAPALVNGAFDQGRVAWSELINNVAGRLILRNGETSYMAQSPEWFTWLGGAPNEETKVRQDLTPALPTRYPIYVQFYYLLESAESDCARDRAEVRVGKTGDAPQKVWELGLCDANKTDGAWRVVAPVNLSLEALKGQVVAVELAATLDGARNSNFLVDTVTLCTTTDGIPGIAKCPTGVQTAPSVLPATDSLPDPAPVARDAASDAATEGSE